MNSCFLKFFFDREGVPTNLFFVVVALIVALIVAFCGGCVNAEATRTAAVYSVCDKQIT